MDSFSNHAKSATTPGVPALPSGKSPGTRYTGLGMIMLGAIFFGTSATAAQQLFHAYAITPGWLVSIRMLLAGIVLLVGLSITRGISSVFGVWRSAGLMARVFLFSLLGVAAVQYTWYTAIQLSNAATATFLQFTAPALIVLYMAIRQRRLPHTQEVLALVLTIAGTLLLVTEGKWQSLQITPAAFWWGIASAVAFSFHTLYPVSLIQRFGAPIITAWAMIIGGVLFSLYSQPWTTSAQVQWGLATVLLILFIVLFGTAIGFILFLGSLKHITPAEASIVGTIEPLAAALSASMILNVDMDAWAWSGGVLITLTVVLLALPQRLFRTRKQRLPEQSPDYPESPSA